MKNAKMFIVNVNRVIVLTVIAQRFLAQNQTKHTYEGEKWLKKK